MSGMSCAPVRMFLRGLFFLGSAGVHAQNGVGRAKAEQRRGEGNRANHGPDGAAQHPPDDECATYCNTDVTIGVTNVCCHAVLRVREKWVATHMLFAAHKAAKTHERSGFSISVLGAWVVAAFALAAGGALADVGDDFLAARAAWAAGDMRKYEHVAEKIPPDSVFQPYLAYWTLARQLDHDVKVADYLASYPGSWLAEKLRAEWLKNLGKRELWPAYLAEFVRLEKPETIHLCLARRAELALGDRRAIKDAAAMWLTGRDMPSACSPLFSWLMEQGYLNEEDVWKRLRLTLEAGNPGVAKSLLSAIPESRRPTAIWIDRIMKQPADFLESQQLDWTSRPQQELGFFAVDRLARTDTVAAARVIEPVLASLPESARHYVWGLLAVQAARRHEPQALPWFANSGGQGLSDYQREWWVRAALRAADWRGVQQAISGMSQENRNLATWRYWQGRALKANGQLFAANQIFAPLSREHHYYGLLAQEELGSMLGGQTVNIKTSGAEVDNIAREPGIARALALYGVGLRSEAAQEWIWAVRNMNDRQLLAAAELARRNNWYDRAINTAERTRDLHDFDLRFISPYRELAAKEAKEQGVDEAWVFGLIRQESRFVNVAKSGVGAAGLMQIMPATGSWIARKLGIKTFNTRDLNEPETNLKFGTFYLRHIQDSLDGHPVLATAAYNAGPRRAQRWRGTKPMEGAVYIESIPFQETRDYVKKVMANAMYYALRFGQPSVLLSHHLGTIPPRLAPALPVDANDTLPTLEAVENGN